MLKDIIVVYLKRVTLNFGKLAGEKTYRILLGVLNVAKNALKVVLIRDEDLQRKIVNHVDIKTQISV